MEDVMAEISLDATCADLFDHIDDLLEFPSEDDVLLEMDLPARNSPCVVLPAVLEPLLPLPLQDHTLLGRESGDKSDHNRGASTEPNLEEEKLVTGNEDLDVAQLEWLSNFFDETTDAFTLDLPNFSSKEANNIESYTAKAETAANEAGGFFRTSSPVSVLEHSNSLNGGSGGGGSASSYSSSSSSSNSSSGSGSGSGSRSSSSSSGSSARAPEPLLVIPARARSKRARPAAFSGRPHVTIPFPAPPSNASGDGEGIAESSAPPPPPPMKKKKKIKKVGSSLTDAAAAATAAAEEGYPQQQQQQQQQAPAPVRKCMHCEIQKTPQWRAGPMGPKTLCNACGVRYKSGRLFPEYRPAASPTFVPAVHSNSHKKVVEMRLKAKTTGGRALPSSDLGRDLLDYIRRRE